jgi:tRNA threonylcarbamoyladenosine modification (KEOPS) complex Cgi121 subunit
MRVSAVENSLSALSQGVRQIECSINGLGARRGNADLGTIVRRPIDRADYWVGVDATLLSNKTKLFTQNLSAIQAFEVDFCVINCVQLLRQGFCLGHSIARFGSIVLDSA